jgi:hypothetical protein
MGMEVHGGTWRYMGVHGGWSWIEFSDVYSTHFNPSDHPFYSLYKKKTGSLCLWLVFLCLFNDAVMIFPVVLCFKDVGPRNCKIVRSYSVEINSKMQPCNRIYYSTVHWRLNMFRAANRSSSGALIVFATSGLHTHVMTGRRQVWVGTWASLFIITTFIEGWKCFERHTAHHQEL